MLKPTVILGIPGEKLRQRLSHRARNLVRESQFIGRIVDLVMFPYNPSKVVTSAAIVKMLDKNKGHENQLVVVGWDFTIEARALLQLTGAIVFSHHEFGWTDERWATIRQL